ncbi:MAG TPA: lipocalin family protein [Burkholderiaceae bacterium]|nr:lipocalin family protein [Burkholderiaceae bacterium]
MKNLRSPPDRSPPPELSGSASLDDRIRAVEQRLVAREQTLALRFDAFADRLRAATRPRRVLPPAVGIGVALFVLLWLLRTRVPPPIAHARQGAPAAGGEGSWAQWLALAWPLLPTAWRARVSPASAAALVSVGLPLAERLLTRPSYPPLDTVARLDLARYAGTWYEIARLPVPSKARCDGQPRAHYALHGDGLLVRNACPHHGKQRTASGVARTVPGSGGAKLKISLWPAWLRWLPPAWSDYWVLHVDEGYRVAVVGHPDRRHLWLLSRERRLDAARLDALLRFAGARGFAVERLIVSQPA